MHRTSPQPGYITLITIIVVGAIVSAITVSLLLLGLSSSRTSAMLDQSNVVQSLANACADEALKQINNSTTFSGTGSLALNGGSCTYTVTNLGGQSRTIRTSGTKGTVVRKISITINAISPTITIASWQEVAD